MSVLIDTSVWVDHFRHRNKALVSLLEADMAMTHPMVLLELACETPPAPRSQTLADLALLSPANQANLTEVMDFIELQKLYGLGCGLVDISLLAATLMTPDSRLWTLDKRLALLTERFGVSFAPSTY
jgi:hypothetical protein